MQDVKEVFQMDGWGELVNWFKKPKSESNVTPQDKKPFVNIKKILREHKETNK